MKNESTIDPFATDLFLTAAAVARSRPHAAGRSVAENWHRRLPRITEQQLLASSGLLWLPGIQVESIARTLALYTQSLPDLVSVIQTTLREHEAGAISSSLDTPPVAYASLHAGSDGAPMALEVDAQFAARIIDRTLGGEGTPLDALRGLSRTEHAVMEFLCLVLCREVNAELGVPLVRLAGVGETQPEWLAGKQNQAGTRRLTATFTVVVNENSGSVRMHFSPEALSELRRVASTEGLSGANGIRGNASLVSRKVRRFAAVTPDIPLTLLIGHSEVAAGDLASLECGDVVIIHQPSGRWVDGGLAGIVSLRTGGGERASINARVIEENRRDGSRAPMTVAIESIHAENAAGEEQQRMEEHSQTDGAGEGAALLDGLLLTVHVELAGRRMRMDELAQLRTGQILELGCLATDPVDLVVDGRSIARGELVDIEGRLGVRIAQVRA